MVTTLSALAYLGLVLLLAGGPDIFKSLRDRPSLAPGLAGPLAGFLFLPTGGLPPFLDFAWSGSAFWLGLSLGPLGRMARGLKPRRAETLLQLFFLILAWLFLCFYALKRGLPGDLPGLSVFAATPLLAQAGPAAGPGLICLFLALGPLAARREADNRSDPALLMSRFSISAFLISVFFPFGLSGVFGEFLGWPLALSFDFFLFWGQVLLLNRVIAPRLDAASRTRSGRTALGIFAAAGLLLIIAEIF